jgi:predicted acyltransferase
MIPAIKEAVLTAPEQCTAGCIHTDVLAELFVFLIGCADSFAAANPGPDSRDISLASHAFHIGYRMAQLEQQAPASPEALKVN